jgi:hypothetical protein
MKRDIGKFLLDASIEVLKSSSLGFPESGLGFHCTPSPSELASSRVGLSGPANRWPHTHMSGPSLSRD